MTVKQKLIQLQIPLAAPPGPFGAYVPAKRVGDVLHVSGQLPMTDGQLLATGLVGDGVSIDDAKACARQCAVNALAAAETVPGGVNHLAGVIAVTVYVAGSPSFTDQPAVADAASGLLHEVFDGAAGQHVRAAVGVASLPKNAPVEVAVTFACRPERDPTKFVLNAETDAPDPPSLGPDKPENIPS